MFNTISARCTQFDYFDEVLGHPHWKGRKVLDFGGNAGNFLIGSGDAVDHGDYWCMDVLRAALEHGRSRFPRAHFVHFDRYSSEYNPGGVRGLPIPGCGVRFDVIIAFSVFTHTDRSEMLELVAALRRMLAPGGKLAFTFCDARYDRSLSDHTLPPGSDVRKNLTWQQVHNTAEDIDRLVERAMGAQWCVVIDEEVHCQPGDELSHQIRQGKPGESYCSYYTTECMQSLFPDAAIVAPVSPEWQHCCVLNAL